MQRISWKEFRTKASIIAELDLEKKRFLDEINKQKSNILGIFVTDNNSSTSMLHRSTNGRRKDAGQVTLKNGPDLQTASHW